VGGVALGNSLFVPRYTPLWFALTGGLLVSECLFLADSGRSILRIDGLLWPKAIVKNPTMAKRTRCGAGTVPAP